MKKAAFTFGSFVLLALAISSCSKNALDQPNFPGLRCAVGNTEYIADTAYYIKNTTTRGTDIYALTGTQTRFRFSLIAADTIGTYTLDSLRNTAYYLDGSKTYRSTSGTLVISQYFNDSLAKITGTFNFKGRANDGSTVSVDYGYFNDIHRH